VLQRPGPVAAGALQLARTGDQAQELLAPKLRARDEVTRLVHIEILNGG
jgi:hypothetical protein